MLAVKKIYILAIFLFTSVLSFSQASNLGSWYAYIGTYDLSPRWNVQFITQARYHNIMGDWDQYLIRTGANYSLSKDGKYSIGAGLDYFYNEQYIGNTDNKNDFTECRIYEQFITRSDYKRFYLQHRYRLENRFLQGQDVKFRFRYFLQVRMALNKKRIEKGTLYLSVLNEAFWNLQGPFHFDRHWLHYTLGYQLNENLTFEVGNQTQFTGNGIYNSRLQFWAFHNMNFKKKKRLENLRSIN